MKKFFNKVKNKVRGWVSPLIDRRKGPVKLSTGEEVMPYCPDEKYLNNYPDLILIQRVMCFVNQEGRLVIGFELYTNNRTLWILRGKQRNLNEHADKPEVKRLIVRIRNAFGGFNSSPLCLKLFTRDEMVTWGQAMCEYLDGVANSTDPESRLKMGDILEDLGTFIINDFHRHHNVFIRNKGSKRWGKKQLKPNFTFKGEDVEKYTVDYAPLFNKPLTMPNQSIREPQWFDSIVDQAVKEFTAYNKTYPIIVRAGVAYSRIGKHWIMNVGEKGILIKPDNRKEVLLTNKLLATSGANPDNIHMFWVGYINDGYEAKIAGLYHDWRINGVSSQSNS